MIPRRYFWTLDVITLIIAFLMAYALFPRLQALLEATDLLEWPATAGLRPASSQPPPLLSLGWILVAMVPTTLFFLEVFGNNTSLITQSYTRIVVGGFLAPFAGLSVITLVMYALSAPGSSRLFVFSFVVIGGTGLAAYRAIQRAYLLRRQRAGYYAKNVLLVGLKSGIDWMQRYFENNPVTVEHRLLGYVALTPDQPEPAVNGALAVAEGKPAGSLGPNAPARLTPSNGARLPRLGEVSQLGHLLIHHPIHEVIVVYPHSGGHWLEQVIRDCDDFRVTLRIVPEALLCGEPRTLQVLYHTEPLHLPAVVLRPPEWDSDAVFFKRIFDVVVSATLLVLLAPLFGAIALAIKLTTPELPVLYRWRVVGQKGVEFTGYKFSTMVANADELKAELLSQNEMIGPVFKIKNDPRITPLGRILRKYSLDELPQLWCVLKGEMSLVGPRPAFRHELERYELWQKRKLSIRPGITCLWQVRGRNAIKDFDEWVRMDLEYIDNWSLWLDFKILLRTVGAVLRGTGT